MKDYYSCIGNLLRTKKVTFGVNEIEDPSDPNLVISDPGLVKAHLSERYSEIFGSEIEREPFKIGFIEDTHLEELC